MEKGQSVNLKKNRKVTMLEVAKQSGVALSTVSHVINGTASISEETKNRVLQIINELNYTPNALARGLRQNRTNVIGVIVPDIANEFYAKTASAILKAASGDDNVTVLVDTGYSYDREKSSVEALIKSRIDGLIFLGGGNDEVLIDQVDSSEISIVLADRRYKEYSSVEFNNQESMTELVEILFEKGYRHIGYISESLDMTNLQDRYDGLMQGLKNCGLTINEEWILSDSWLKLEKLDKAKALMQKLISNMKRENMPEVFIASSDMIAVGILDALIKNGYRVPEEIGVVGYDNITLARYYQPAITTIEQDCIKFGKAVYQLLKNEMEGRTSDVHEKLSTRLIVRKSIKSL